MGYVNRKALLKVRTYIVTKKNERFVDETNDFVMYTKSYVQSEAGQMTLLKIESYFN